MAHQQLLAHARSRWHAIAISSRVFHVYTGSFALRRTANATKMSVVCRTYSSTSIVGTPQKLPISPKYPKSQSSSAHTPRSPRPTEATSSSAQTSRYGESQKINTKLIPEVYFYHNPASTASVKILALLQGAQVAYPQSKRRTGPPLDFNLNILERLPTAEELQDMYSLLDESSWTIFRAKNTASNYRQHPTSARSLLDLISHERQEEITKAKEKAYDNAVVAMTPATDTSPSELSAELPRGTLAILDVSHPLFGTQTFCWPTMVCRSAKSVIVGPRLKNVARLLKNFANERDDVKTAEQIKEEAEKARQANWSYPEKEVSPDEDDTLNWFNESSRRVKKVSW